MDRKGRRGPVVGWGHVAMCIHTDGVRSLCVIYIYYCKYGRKGGRERREGGKSVLELG